MNYCKHLKKRKNKPFCTLLNREITLSECCNCINKEYKSNNNQLKKKSTFKEKNPLRSKPMKNKSNKLARLERKRTSVFTNDLEHCLLCGKKKNDLHEIFSGKNRINSIKYNFVIPLCRECHAINQNDYLFNNYWHCKAQKYFEEHIGNRDDFIKIFRKNYLN